MCWNREASRRVSTHVCSYVFHTNEVHGAPVCVRVCGCVSWWVFVHMFIGIKATVNSMSRRGNDRLSSHDHILGVGGSQYTNWDWVYSSRTMISVACSDILRLPHLGGWDCTSWGSLRSTVNSMFHCAEEICSNFSDTTTKFCRRMRTQLGEIPSQNLHDTPALLPVSHFLSRQYELQKRAISCRHLTSQALRRSACGQDTVTFDTMHLSR